MSRFEQEARSASSLNHPNIITIHEIGSVDSTTYIAMEWVDGKTLRDALKEGPLPARKVIQIAVQIADGLTKAHEAGIVHRDLKPENIMITKDGFAKILDFGLAKLFMPSGSEVSALPTSAGTDVWTILGTVGYMSPEQASGKAVDFRSDQFSLGAILYEMLIGKKAFEEKTTIETLAAIINKDAEPISSATVQAPAPLRWIIERCLEKNSEDRYASSRDLAHDLQSIRDHYSEVASSTETAVPVHLQKRSLKKIWSIANIALLLILGGSTLFLLMNPKKVEKSNVNYHRLTYQRGSIHSARFAADGQTIIYSASFAGAQRELYLTRTEGVESRALGIPNADILSISPSGEMLVLILNKKNTLAQVPITGGLPRELDQNISGADWAPDGHSMAIARTTTDISTNLEYPSGKILYQGIWRIDTVRFSPNGDYIAFIEGAVAGSNGAVRILNTSGKQIAAFEGLFPDKLSWSKNGDEVLFSTVSDHIGGGYELYALSVAGKQHLVSRFPSSFVLDDISKKGQFLAEFADYRGILMAGTSGNERELSWLDNSDIADFSSDGKMLLIHERGEGSESPLGTMYIRNVDGSAGVRLAAGSPFCFSADNLFILGFSGTTKVLIVPVGVGKAQSFDYPQFKDLVTAGFLPDGKKFVFLGVDKEGHTETFLQDISGGKPKSLGIKDLYPMGSYELLSPDGRLLFGRDAAGTIKIYGLDGTAPIPISGMEQNEIPVQWNRTSDAIFVFNNQALPAKIYRIGIPEGRRTLFKEIMPPDRAGVRSIRSISISPDEKSYAYTYTRRYATLYLIDGIH
ncbi:WD40 repeat domain-containing serine/threonine protein kinase [bacterium]|nr:WD40 repeat domain-containing serine/threonine protein kinase [bacterium]